MKRFVRLFTILLFIVHATCKQQDLYKTLGVPKSASSKDITKAYRKLALKYHPDKVDISEREASEKKFKDIGYAHEILADDEKRKRYDTYGEQGLDESFHPGFSNMNGSGTSPFGGFHQQNGFNQETFSFGGRPSDGNDMGIDLGDILRQFMGGHGGMGMPGNMGGRNVGGGVPGGSGSRSRAQQDPLRPQMKEFYCTLGELSDMNGCTKKLKVTVPCTDPMTGQQNDRDKVYTLDILPGWKEGTKIHFKATRDGYFPPMTFVLKEKQHKYIKRQGDDLIYQCEVTNRQAEKGSKLRIPLPAGEVLEVQTAPDEIYDNYVKKVKGKGMPKRQSDGDRNERGDFLIVFQIRHHTQSHR